MEVSQIKAVIEAILFASGKEVNISDLICALEISKEDIEIILDNMISEYKNNTRGIEIIKIEDNYQLITKKDYYPYICNIFDNRSKPNLSHAALETLSIIAYNSKITRAEIEAIRGVNSDGTIYKLLEYNLIEVAGKLDIPGKPTAYKTTVNFLKTFGMTNLAELPELPKYKIDENEQIVLDEITENYIEKEEIINE